MKILLGIRTQKSTATSSSKQLHLKKEYMLSMIGLGTQEVFRLSVWSFTVVVAVAAVYDIYDCRCIFASRGMLLI
ncbi:hypothetical protein SCA6_000403 [Theobroma cacao]